MSILLSISSFYIVKSCLGPFFGHFPVLVFCVSIFEKNNHLLLVQMKTNRLLLIFKLKDMKHY